MMTGSSTRKWKHLPLIRSETNHFMFPSPSFLIQDNREHTVYILHNSAPCRPEVKRGWAGAKGRFKPTPSGPLDPLYRFSWKGSAVTRQQSHLTLVAWATALAACLACDKVTGVVTQKLPCFVKRSCGLEV